MATKTDKKAEETEKQDLLLSALLGEDEAVARAAASILAEKINALSPEARRRFLDALDDLVG